ncbi:CHAT domain-containing protein [Paraburkholderia nemoris]|uniref:hypothetical protein n=1 Tax=Paraburkholderia nemoris TaxID=2793076 RepID=UPI0038B8A204
MDEQEESRTDTLSVQYLLDPRFRVYYLVPFKREGLEDASPFRLYSNGLMGSSRLHALAARLPADIREINADWAAIARLRCARAIEHQILPVFLDAFADATTLFRDMPFRCVLSDSSTADAIDNILKAVPERWLHLSLSEGGKGRLNPFNLSWSDFSAALSEAIASTGASSVGLPIEVFQHTVSEPTVSPQRALAHQPRQHGVTVMNEFAVTAVGAIDAAPERLASKDRTEYVAAILKSVDELHQHRQWLDASGSKIRYQHKLCIAVPSVLTYFYSNSFSKNNLGRREVPDLHRLILSFVRQQTYIVESNEKGFAGFQTSEGQALMSKNAEELHTFTASLSVFATRTLTPVLRLEPKINGIRSSLARLAALSRGNNPRRLHKVNLAAKDLMSEMKAAIEPRYMELIAEQESDNREGVKLVSDLPLEWLPVNELPLMMAFETSRVAATPGNVSLEQLVLARTRHLAVSSFSDVLVIRSYTDDDPIRDVLSTSLESLDFSEMPLNVKVRIVDVATPEEFIDAWNGFDGAILIFDGHGKSDSVTGVGQLIIAGKPVTIWSLNEKLARSPPIVLLSACDTHSIDANHATVANTMLMLGATTVLATFLPVDAVYAALFVRRLLVRVAGFLPLIAAKTILGPSTWRGIVTGMQRMSYVTEIMAAMQLNEGFLPLDVFEGIQWNANMEINGGDPDWFEKFVGRMATKSGRSIAETRVLMAKWASLVDIMHYVQLGNPEALLIVTDELQATMRGEEEGTPPSDTLQPLDERQHSV